MIDNLQNKNRHLVIGGINTIWYLPMTKVTRTPALCNSDIRTNELTVTSVLSEIDAESGSLELYAESDIDSNGVSYQLQLLGENIGLSPEKDNELQKIMQQKQLIVFKDNKGQWRFIINARFKDKHGTGLFRDGKPAYTIMFTGRNVITAYYFTGTVTINPDRTLSIT